MLKSNKRIWLSLFLLVVLYFIQAQEYEGLAFLQGAPRVIKNSFNYFLFILVTAIGYFGWSNHPQAWIKKIWIFTYACVFAILSIFGTFDILIGIPNLNTRSFFREFRVFFSGPFPFVILLFLNRAIQQSIKSKKDTFQG